MQFIDDGVPAGVSRDRLGGKGHGSLARQTAQRRASVGRARSGARFAAELWGKEQRWRIGIEQDLLRVEAQSMLGVVRPSTRYA
jgi:hypothetical protein